MPQVLENCVEKLKKEGYPDSKAWAICSKKTGWKKAPGGGWRKREKGKWLKHKGKETKK